MAHTAANTAPETTLAQTHRAEQPRTRSMSPAPRAWAILVQPPLPIMVLTPISTENTGPASDTAATCA